LFLPGVFSQPTTFSRTLTFQSTTLENPNEQTKVLAVFSDLQRDLFASPRAEDNSRHEGGLSVTSLLLLDAGFADARAGRVSPVPADWLLDVDED
jgi:hypothetical protein